MKQISNQQAFTPSTQYSDIYNRCLTLIAVKIKACEPLLYKIAVGFGFNESESRDLIKQVYTCAPKTYLNQQDHRPLQIWLAKIIVHKCIFIIGSRLFSQVNSSPAKKDEVLLSYYYGYVNAQVTKPQDIPLSFRAVFILKTIGFDETEIATILNTTALKVRERFSKALAYINSY